MKNKHEAVAAILITILSCIGLSVLLFLLIVNNGLYPSGEDTMYHLHSGNMLYKAFANNEKIPLYDRFYYNGTQPFRYDAPVSFIVLALCITFSYGQIYIGYVYYCILLFVIGQIVWTVIGFKVKKPLAGAVFGLMWFFIPANINTLFVQGNLSMSLCLCFLPVLLYSVIAYLECSASKYLITTIISLCLMILTHTGFAALTCLFILLYLVIQRLFHKNNMQMISTVVALIVSFMICGFYLVPSFIGGYDFERYNTASNYFQDFWITINPLYRLNVSNDAYYFGLAFIVIAILGILASNKRSASGFFTVLLVLLLTSSTAYEIVRIIPGSEALWLILLLPCCACLTILSIMYWTKLRKWALAFFVLVICVDIIPSLFWIYGYANRRQPYDRMNEQIHNTYIDKAQELCEQRIALIDLGSLGSEGPYIISDYGTPKMEIFGTKFETAVTAENITRINMAMTDEYYEYLFDRCLLLGADTIIIQKENAPYGERSLVKLDAAAEKNNYDILYENDEYMLYHIKSVDSYFGTKTVYDSIGIGFSAYSISLAFPNVKETNDFYLDHYSYEELSQYKTVYLSGFYYDDRVAAENLVLKLSENGVRIVILADGIPEDRDTRTKTFLGVTCNIVQFENGYPILYTEDFGEMDCDLFPRAYAKWSTYYLIGLSDIKGTIFDNEIELAFMGYGANENISYVGLNIPFYYYLTEDKNVEKIMQWIMQMEPGVLPEKELYPIEITFNLDEIIIQSPVDDLNTSLSFQDIFVSDKAIRNDNNLLVVDSGTTAIKFKRPYLKEGIIVSLIGLIAGIGFVISIILKPFENTKNLQKEEIKPEEIKPEEIKQEEEIKPEEETKTEEKAEEKTNTEVRKESCEEIEENNRQKKEESLTNYKHEFDIAQKTNDDFDIPFGKKS